MRTMKTLTLAACLQFLFVSVFCQQVAKSIPYPASPDGIIGFLEFRPSDYGTQKHPLIIFLHGWGERGNGSPSQIGAVANNGVPNYCANGAPMRFTVAGQTSSFVVLSPQLSAWYGAWQTYYVREMIKYAKANLSIDTNRIYVTGLSLGGGGTWNTITDAPGGDYSFDAGIAAAAPVCGTQETNDANFYQTVGANHLPVWAFHSMDDGTVGVGATQHAEILGSIQGINNPTMKFTYYQSGGHSGCWVNAYDTGHITRTVNGGGSFTANPNLYEWFLSKTRAGNTPPVTSAGAAKTITLPANTVTLTGTANGTNGATISSYAWVKTSGPAGGNISTANAATTDITALQQGVYVFKLTSTDNHALTSSSTVTVTVLAALVVNAGASQIITSASTMLDATGTWSPNGSIASYTWQQVSGPSPATILNAAAATTTVNNMLQGGTYLFKLTATDMAGASGSATTNVEVLFMLLPVEFTYFKAQKNDGGSLLQWAASNEPNNDYFIIERSTDGTNFGSFGKIAGAGNTNTVNEYSYTDAKLSSGTYYYRLKQVDGDGKFVYSTIMMVKESSKTGISQVYPNPVLSNLSIVVDNDVKGAGKISVYDLSGRNVRETAFEKNDKIVNTSVNMNNLVAGLYIVEVKIGNSYKLTNSVLKK